MSDTVSLTPYTAGENAYQALEGVAAGLGTRLVLIGGHRAMAAGLPRLRAALEDTALVLCAVLPFSGHCTVPAAKALADRALAHSPDIIVGMGGGRALDCAKAVGHFMARPVLTLPTIAATCAAVSALSVMYHPDGSLDQLLQLASPPKHCFIDIGVLRDAPTQYLRAGIGDSLAKHVEVPFSARGHALEHSNALGLAIAQGLWPAFEAHAAPALAEARARAAGPHLQAAALSCIVSVGYASTLVDERFNCALAHSLYYAMEPLPAMRNLLHGDVVAWGALVQLTLDGQLDKAAQLRALLSAMGTPTRMQDMGLSLDDPALRACVHAAAAQPDMACVPHPISPEDIMRAVRRCEEEPACLST